MGPDRRGSSLRGRPSRRAAAPANGLSATGRLPGVRIAARLKDKSALQSLAASSLAACGYRLLEFVVGSDRRVRLVIDAEPEVDLKDCVRAHKAVLDGLRAAGEDPEEFAIEVDSPGANRLLSSERDFERFRGEGVVVRSNSEVGGRKVLYGILLGCEDGVLRLAERDSRSEVRFEMPNVKEVRLHRS